MAFTNKVDYIPNQSFAHSTNTQSEQDIKKHQSQKWTVLFGTFLLISILGNLWIWTQPPVYQSQAILHFAYPSDTELEYSQLAERKMNIHQQRLTSNSVLQQTQQHLATQSAVEIDIQALSQLLSAQASGRIVTLTAEDSQPEILEQVISSWIDVYTQLMDSEKQQNNTEELLTSNTQLQALNEKILAQQAKASAFAEKHNITSLERDENRVLNKIRSLSNSLDEATAEQTSAQATLNSLKDSVQKGQPILRDADKAEINQIRQSLQLLTNELTLLKEKYTQAYLDRDPAIVRKQQTAEKLKSELAAKTKESEVLYLQEARRNLEIAKDKVKQTQLQFEQHSAEAQSFSQKLQQYKILNDELDALQDQAKAIRNQQVKQEVSQPFDAKISVLEPAYTPEFPSGPEYLLWTLICLLIALGAGVLALFLFGYIVKQKQPESPAANFVVMSGNTVADPYNQNQLAQGQTAKLGGAQSEPLGLAENQTHMPSRLLSLAESKSLINVANQQTKIIVSLVYTGLTKQEIIELPREAFIDDCQGIVVLGSGSRTVQVASQLRELLRDYLQSLTVQAPLWSNIESSEDLDHMLVNLAHDAGLSEPNQVNIALVRHTYISYLVSQGCRLNDLEQIVGPMVPSQLSQYRGIVRQEQVKNISEVDRNYPLFV